MDFLEREGQTRQLNEALALARRGQGRIVAIVGEAGAGKTTLVDRFIGACLADERVYRGACENLSTPEVLLPWRDIARASGTKFSQAAEPVRLFESLLGMLADSVAPTIVVIEDLHWADTATLDSIRYLARRIGTLRSLVVLTYRDEEIDARSPVRNMLGEAPPQIVRRLLLEPLSRQAVTALAAQAGRNGDELFALTAGNPFLVTEALAVEGNLPTAAVTDATLARVSRLPPAARDVLDAVSLFPRHAETAIVAEMVNAGFDSGLDACVERGMLSLEGASLRFRHELARRAVESWIPPSRRRALHQLIVRELVRRPNARASEIAHHAGQAGDIGVLTKFARRAGEAAARAGAPREAAAHYGAILEHRATLDDRDLEELLERYAEQCYLMGAADLAMTSMEEAAAMRRASGATLALGRSLMRLTRFAWMCGQRPAAEEFVAEAIDVLEKEPSGAELAWAYSHKAQLHMLASQMDIAVDWGHRALVLAERLGDRELLIHALANIGAANADNPASGSFVELERSLNLALAGQFHDHVERASCNLSCSHYVRRDQPGALGYIEQGVAYALSHDLAHWEGYLRGWRAMVRMDQGEWSAAEQEIELILSRHYASAIYRFPALVALARLRLRRGDPDADAPREAATELAVAFGELQRTVYAAALAAEKAWLHGADDPTDAVASAIGQLGDVYAIAAQRNARWVAEDASLWLHTLGAPAQSRIELTAPFRDHCLGQWRSAADGWAALGRPYERAMALSGGDDAAQREALGIFDGLGAVPASNRLRREMRARGARSVPRGPSAGTRANPAGLTRRQIQVLALIEEGSSNLEIADRLCISPKTAEHHVSAVISRLDVTTRREAAAAARSRRLLP